MKLEKNLVPIQTNMETDKETKFTISANRHIFDILRKSIYSDPIGSCVREITANARDAQRKVGKENIPIRITLTSNYVVFSDCGVGMSEWDIENVYSAYGESSKRDNNIEQGGFGIGGKVIMAVTDSYSLETIWEGIKYTYLCYINEEGSGAIKLINKEISDECGTTVKVPIPQDKYDEFKTKIYHYTAFWAVSPRYLGELPWPAPKPTMQGTNWRVYPDEVFRRYGSINVLSDDIPYDYRNYNVSIPDGVVFCFGVGELDIAATRESLVNSQRNLDSMRAAKEIYLSEVYDSTFKTVQDEPDYVEALKLINSYHALARQKKDWIWQGKAFAYPLDYEIEFYGQKHYGSFRKTINTTHSVGRIVANSFISRPDQYELNSYDTRRIKHHMNVHGLNNLYLVNETQTSFPFPIAAKLKDIKIPATNTGPRTKRSVVKIYEKGKKSGNYVDLGGSTRYIYVETFDNSRLYYLLPHKVVRLDSRYKKKIAGNNNFVAMADFIKEKLGKYNVDYLKAEGFKINHNDDLNKFRFLKDYVPAEFKEKMDDTSLPNDLHWLAQYIYLNGEPQEYNLEEILLEQYPLLQHYDGYYYYDKAERQKPFLEYVKMVNHLSMQDKYNG